MVETASWIYWCDLSKQQFSLLTLPDNVQIFVTHICVVEKMKSGEAAAHLWAWLGITSKKSLVYGYSEKANGRGLLRQVLKQKWTFCLRHGPLLRESQEYIPGGTPFAAQSHDRTLFTYFRSSRNRKNHSLPELSQNSHPAFCLNARFSSWLVS